MRPLPAIIVGLAIGASPVSVAAATLVVAPDGSGDHATIQDAIDASIDGDIIELLDGVFTGPRNHDLDPGGRAILIRSRSGSAAGAVIDCEGAGRGFIFQTSEGPSTRIEYLTIQGGVDEGSVPRGGAVFCGPGTSPALTGCEIRDSFAWAPDPDFGAGGGVYCGEGSAATFDDCLVTGCWAISGGGILAAPGSAVEIRNSVLALNEARGGFGGGAGGGAFLSGTSRIENSIVHTNEADAGSHGPGLGGGLLLAEQAVAIGCEILGNISNEGSCCPGWGGGVFSRQGSNTTLEDCLIAGNVANLGAGLAASGPTLLVGCTVADNGGGGILVADDGVEIRLERTIAWGNCGNELRATLGRITVSCGAVGPGGVAGDVELPADVVTEDPRFCEPGHCATAPFTFGDYALQMGSPCAPEHSPCGELIGYRGVACGATPVRSTTWGGLKQLSLPATPR